jgi:hypothetical protein
MNVKRLSVGLVLTLFASSYVVAQGSFIPYDNKYLSEKITNYTSRKTTENGIDNIPEQDIYQYVFLTILGNPALAKGLNAHDLNIIMHLPSHEDPQFAVPAYKELTEACNYIAENQRSVAAHDVAHRFVQAEAKISLALQEHYRLVLNSMSVQGLALIEQLKSELNGTRRIVSTTVDYEGLSQELPEFVRALHVAQCQKIEEFDTADIKPKLLSGRTADETQAIVIGSEK